MKRIILFSLLLTLATASGLLSGCACKKTTTTATTENEGGKGSATAVGNPGPRH